MELLSRYNEVPVVMVWTDAGPQYLLRSLTLTAKRINDKLYYNSAFEDLLVGAALRARGHVSHSRTATSYDCAGTAKVLAHLTYLTCGCATIRSGMTIRSDYLIRTVRWW